MPAAAETPRTRGPVLTVCMVLEEDMHGMLHKGKTEGPSGLDRVLVLSGVLFGEQIPREVTPALREFDIGAKQALGWNWGAQCAGTARANVLGQKG